MPYKVIGSIVSILYWEPRLTHDTDRVIQIDTGRTEDFVRLFPILEYFREGGSEKHIHDIRCILAQSRDQVDYKTVEEWISWMGLQDDWIQCNGISGVSQREI